MVLDDEEEHQSDRESEEVEEDLVRKFTSMAIGRQSLCEKEVSSNQVCNIRFFFNFFLLLC